MRALQLHVVLALIAVFAAVGVRRSAEPMVTNVSRETVASWVGATFRLSMLKPRVENRFVTRDNAPASFCSRIEMICRMLEVRLLPRLLQYASLHPPSCCASRLDTTKSPH